MRYLTLRFLLAVLTMLALSLWLWERVAPAGGLWPIMVGGLRIDLVMISMVAVLPAVLSAWLGHLHWPTRLTAWWFRFAFMLFVLLEVCSPQFLIEYDSRPNRLFFEYLSTPREVAAMLWGGYKSVLLAAALVLALAAWAAVRLFPAYRPDRAWPWWRRAVVSVVVLAVGVLAIRGTLAHRPINPSTVAFAGDAMVNTLPLNGLYSVVNAAYRMKDERSSAKLYPSMAPAHMHALVRQAAGFEEPWLDPERPSLHAHTASVRRDKPLNLVIIIQESLGAQYVKSLGGQDLTPRLDALSKEGWMFAGLCTIGPPWL